MEHAPVEIIGKSLKKILIQVLSYPLKYFYFFSYLQTVLPLFYNDVLYKELSWWSVDLLNSRKGCENFYE